MAFETLIYEKEEGMGIITLNRPDQMHSLNIRLKEEISQLFQEIEKEPDIKAVILTGGEKAFCAGSDIKERLALKMSAAEFYLFQQKTHKCFERIESLGVPVIAAISGLAIGGGCELALVCDLRIASETARFGLPEVKIGMIPAGGGTQRLTRLIGVTKAKEMLFTGSLIDAHEAYRLGLVNKVVPVDRLLEESKDIARKLLDQPPLAIKMAKRAVNIGIQLDLTSALEYEALCASVLSATEDFNEGLKAFSEKRKPNFKGR